VLRRLLFLGSIGGRPSILRTCKRDIVPSRRELAAE
jgi:hypothetical protein